MTQLVRIKEPYGRRGEMGLFSKVEILGRCMWWCSGLVMAAVV